MASHHIYSPSLTSPFPILGTCDSRGPSALHAGKRLFGIQTGITKKPSKEEGLSSKTLYDFGSLWAQWKSVSFCDRIHRTELWYN